ncbi:MAG TPA: hypothetical protein VMZ53_29660, partial [Kofleriaceae bacterium]|nr:hypothetical protein [Kofleriaceae bacterium]
RAHLQTQLAERAEGNGVISIDETRAIRIADGRSLHDVLDATGVLEVVPDLQLTAPLGVDDWARTAPLVTFVQLDDTAPLTYIAADGTSSTLPADHAPTGPVLAIGWNERSGIDDDVSVDNTTSSPSVTSSPFYLRALLFTDAMESMFAGDPEMYIKCSSYSVDGVYQRSFAREWVDQANDTIHWYTLNRYVATLGANEARVTCDVKESDGSSGDDLVGTVTFLRDGLVDGTGTYCIFDNGGNAHVGASDVAASTTDSPYGPIPRKCSNTYLWE